MCRCKHACSDGVIWPCSETLQSCYQHTPQWPSHLLSFTAAVQTEVASSPVGLVSEPLQQACIGCQSVTTRVGKGHICENNTTVATSTAHTRILSLQSIHTQNDSDLVTMCCVVESSRPSGAYRSLPFCPIRLAGFSTRPLLTVTAVTTILCCCCCFF